MQTVRIATEDPVEEQWRLLDRFGYASNIDTSLKSRGFVQVEQSTLQLIAGSIRQSRAYFRLATSSPLDISPLLLHYGAYSGLIAACSLATNSPPPIEHHGMVLVDQPIQRIADTALIPRNPRKGALPILASLLARVSVPSGFPWSLGDILSSLPDIRAEAITSYPDILTHCVPVEIVRTKKLALERVRLADLSQWPDPASAIQTVPGLSQAYLTPQVKPDHIILFPRVGSDPIGTYSISGRKHLEIPHQKGQAHITIPQEFLMFMGLFILGSLSRYRPDVWNPFVQSDTTGERLVIEKFISVSSRFFPNLLLSRIVGQRIQFAAQSEGVTDLTSSLTQEEIERMIDEALSRPRAR